FPLCNGSLDEVLGVIHIKDLLGVSANDDFDLKTIVREPMNIPENMAVSQLLNEFKRTHQHWAFVWDEHGTIVGVVTMEQVLEQIVGAVQDEFDTEEPELIKEDNSRYLVSGKMNLDLLNDQLDLNLNAADSDTLSGLLMERAGSHLQKGQVIELEHKVKAELLEVEGMRVMQVRLIVLGREEASKG
ncbi:MAG: transporter associated domain-containing protein, partial [Cyclobacteriaceae bacterium]